MDGTRMVGRGLLLVFVLLLSTSSLGRASQGAIKCFGETATIVGTEKRDRLRGTDGRDVIVGLGGPDSIEGLGGDDLICAGSGVKTSDLIETVQGDAGDDRIHGGRGGDGLFGGPGHDRIWGDGGNDYLVGTDGADRLYGEAGSDTLDGDFGDDLLLGGSSADWFTMDEGEDTFRGGGDGRFGDFITYGRAHRAIIDLEARSATWRGKDSVHDIENVYGPTGGTEARRWWADSIKGDAQNNFLDGGVGDDVIAGREGADCLSTSPHDDRIFGGPGMDVVTAMLRCDFSIPSLLPWPMTGEGSTIDLEAGTAESDVGGSDLLFGIEGAVGTPNDDTLIGDALANLLMGADGNDELRGQEGDDALDGGSGVDSADGGDGTDSCVEAEATFACE